MIRTLEANYLSTFHLPRPASGPAPFHLVRPLGLGLRVLLGIGGGLKDYDRRRRTNASPPKPTAKSESAEGSGTGIVILSAPTKRLPLLEKYG